ncbi:MAG: polysaccharide biosynthesis tyrosine autokinase [Leptolyngbya sp. SIO4C1]|nr:polysaccharide biosynthesis tyrosine autokinase [Leptolyngbya sp. SIO4C1]
MKFKDSFAKEADKDEIDLQRYWQILKRRWLVVVAVCGLTTALSALAVSSKDEIYEAQAKLLFESNQTSSLIGIDGAAREIKALTNNDNPLDTQVEVFRSIPIAEQVIQELQMTNSEGELLQPSSFLSNLGVKGVPGTDVLEISYTSPDPELAATVVNTIMGIYIQNDIQVNRAAAVAAQEFISEQLPETEAQVGAAESALRDFKEANSIVDLGEESRNTVEILSTLDDSLTQLKADLADTGAQLAQIQQKLQLNPQEAYAVGLVTESPGVQEVLVQLQTVESQLALERTRYEEDHPAIAALRRQENALSRLLQERIGIALGNSASALPAADLQAGTLEQGLIAQFLSLEAERAGLAERLELLTGAQSNQQQRAQALPSLEKRQRELERQLNAAQTTYETLLENLQQAQVLENQNMGNARVVSPALVPDNPIAPSTKLYVATGAMLGILLGISAAFLIDLVDRSVKTVREGQERYGYPLLGVIPAWKKLSRTAQKNAEIPSILVREPQPVPTIEAYQALQANLKFSYIDKPLKTITVTSAGAGEGKSEVAANLALTLAQLGHLVLIIDADMRNPVQHHVWDTPNLQGLSNVVAGQLPLKQAIFAKEPRSRLGYAQSAGFEQRRGGAAAAQAGNFC